jgi:curved DNA-binding protein CbpA
MSLYDELEVLPAVTTDEIKKAYYKLAKEYHPDKNPDGVERFKRIEESYKILSNKYLRIIYDYGKLAQYLNMRPALLAPDAENYVNYFGIFGDRITTTYWKRELNKDFAEKNIDKITATLLTAYHNKDPVFESYYFRILGVSVVLLIGFKLWDWGKALFKYTFYGLAAYYIGYRRLLPLLY